MPEERDVSALAATQLDLFLDSRAVMAANEIAAALLVRDSALASARLDDARRAGHEHPELAPLAELTRVLTEWRAPACDAPAIAQVANWLDSHMVPAAAAALGSQGPKLVAHFFAERARDCDAAERAALTIPHWTELPDGLYWTTIARYRLHGLDAARNTLFAFAWRNPQRMQELLAQLEDELLERDWRAFEAASDWESISEPLLPAWF